MDIPLFYNLPKDVFEGNNRYTFVIYGECILLIVSGAFATANLRIGWLLMSISMIILIITRDNPLVEQTKIAKRQCI